MLKCECGKEHDAVPRARYNQVAEARDNEKARADQLQSDMSSAAKDAKASLKAVQDDLKAAQELAGQAEMLQARVAELEGANGKLALRQDFMGAGLLDDEGLTVAETLWGALPEDKRPESVSAWLQDGAPRAVTTYLGQQPAGGGEKAETKDETKRGFTPVGGKGDPNGGSVTAEQVRSMSQAEYDEYMASKYN